MNTPKSFHSEPSQSDQRRGHVRPVEPVRRRRTVLRRDGRTSRSHGRPASSGRSAREQDPAVLLVLLHRVRVNRRSEPTHGTTPGNERNVKCQNNKINISFITSILLQENRMEIVLFKMSIKFGNQMLKSKYFQSFKCRIYLEKFIF